MSAASDVAMVIDRQGVVRDVSISGTEMATEGFTDIVDRRWVDTVTSDSRSKVEEMLQDAVSGRNARWREINHQSARGSIPFRYVAIGTGQGGNVIALGRDLRSVAAMQQRLLQAQQSMERDYVRLRQTESRYRLLFQISSEAVLMVDPSSKRVVEANPAAGALLGVGYETLAGHVFTKLFHPESRDEAGALLLESSASSRVEPASLRLADGKVGYLAYASIFRQDGVSQVLVRLASPRSDHADTGDSESKLLRVLNRIPDAFVIANGALDILDVNLAFLELTQQASAESARGQPLSRFLGRPGVDLNVLVANLREHGWVRNFGSTSRTLYGVQEEIDVSAVSVREGLETIYGFVIRPTRRRATSQDSTIRELPRTGEQLTELVGRVSLREIVRETTDVIERMCIESALNLTGNNRASAAEILGLSRQSLYSKLNRFGLGNSEED
jgi:transcriptional regulator PpsR